jgi:uncharacterized protein
MLRREQVPFHVISVRSEGALDSPQELLDCYLAEGIEDICFNVEESEGDHVSVLFAADGVRNRFRRLLSEFWALSRRSEGIHFVREVDGMLPRVFRPEGSVLGNPQVEPFAMLNIDCQGNVSSFSPELLGLKSREYADFIIGNILTDTLEDMHRSAPMVAMTRDITAGVENCRGSFGSTRTSFCELTQMVPIVLRATSITRI